ncbi:hypothetical protein CHS0354_002791 [Potamilus streckersoni]|uniref:Uncharacterized protein n=1 Tax=Potamilus streckersoni TaxID=2493646 RepID=A0AAE0VZX8_9BIVA|nr:hypothetical protein CHS0354_002791 [Potamilus streckersoni]
MSDSFQVGDCDHGPLTFTVQSSNGGDSKYNVFLTFYSSVILDASPPTCNIPWNGTYLVPTEPWKPDQDLLPSCFTEDSREGYHMTYYWFHIFDWTFH